MIEVKLRQFEGPLDLLLQLIEQRQLDISTVALAEVTDQYLGQLPRVERLHPDELADFLVVAAKLLYLKSKILLPQLDLPAEEDLSLEDQLRLYQTFVGAAEQLKRLFRKRHVMYGREHTATIEPAFAPPERLSLDDLHRTFTVVLQKLEPLFVMPATTIARTVSLQDKINSIRRLVTERAAVSFGELLASARTRMEVIVTFLALLELVKQRTAMVVQDKNFADIRIASADRVEGEERRA
jgi:segregation and condensation protein A